MNNQQDPIAQLQELDRQLPGGPWTVGEVSSSQADIMDAKGSWVGTVRKDFDEDDEPLVIRLRNMLPDLIASFASLRSELTIAGTMIVKVREEANQQRARAEAVEAAMAAKERWQKEAPTTGRWRLSIKPEMRLGLPEVVECEVWFESGAGWVVRYLYTDELLSLDQDWFAGALWQRIEAVADPFDAVERPHSK